MSLFGSDMLKLVNRESVDIEVTEKILEHMEKHNISRKRLAEMMDVKLPRVHQIFSGRNSMTLRTLADILTALDVDLEVELKPRIWTNGEENDGQSSED